MAKQVKIQQAPAAPPEIQKLTTIHAYRIERLSLFEFQAFKVTLKGTEFVEEKFGKADLFELVSRRIFEAGKLEANEVYQFNKKTQAELDQKRATQI